MILAFWSLSLPLMNLSLFRLYGFDITPALICLIFLIFYFIVIVRVKLLGILFFLTIIIYTLANGLAANNDIEFYKSLVLFSMFLLFLVLVSSLDHLKKENIIKSHKLLIIVSFLVGLFLILQFILLNVFGSYLLTPMLGSFSFVGPGGEIYVPNELAILKRPNAIFSEPSVAGWYMAFMIAVTSLYPISFKKKTFLMLVFSLASILTFSLSGIINTIIIWCVLGYIWSRGISAFLAASCFIFFLFGIILYTGIGDLVFNRFGDIATPGTSVYYRVSAPIQLMAESLVKFPFGHALGDIEFISTRDYMINHDAGSQTNIDNSFFMVIYYFGVIGLIITLICILFAGNQLFKKQKIAPLTIALFLLLSQTGALWSPGITILIGYTLVLSRHFMAEGN